MFQTLLSNDVTPFLNEVLKFVILFVIGIIGKFAKDHLVTGIKQKYALMAVHYAEQLLGSGLGANKMELASQWFVNQMKKFHIKVTASEVDGILESSVSLLNQGLKKTVEPALESKPVEVKPVEQTIAPTPEQPVAN